MLKNYLKVTLRNIKRYKGYAVINAAGLAIGMACCILIVLYIQSELSFDRFHKKADRIFLLKRHGLYGGKELTESSNNALSAIYMKKDFPEVENTVRIGFMFLPSVRLCDIELFSIIEQCAGFSQRLITRLSYRRTAQREFYNSWNSSGSISL